MNNEYASIECQLTVHIILIGTGTPVQLFVHTVHYTKPNNLQILNIICRSVNKA
jgi:hypothetical protein